MIVIGIIGGRASGKDTAARYIAGKFNGKHHAHSEILDDILKIMAVDPNRANTDKLFAFRATFGESWLINALNKKILDEDAPVEVITGIRFQNELDNIKNFPNHKTIYIEADPKVRYERIMKRVQRSDEQQLTLEQFMEKEKTPLQASIPELGTQADFKIHHDGTPEELYPKLDQILSDIIK